MGWVRDFRTGTPRYQGKNCWQWADEMRRQAYSDLVMRASALGAALMNCFQMPCDKPLSRPSTVPSGGEHGMALGCSDPDTALQGKELLVLGRHGTYWPLRLR